VDDGIRIQISITRTNYVMAGLVPAIHAVGWLVGVKTATRFSQAGGALS